MPDMDGEWAIRFKTLYFVAPPAWVVMALAQWSDIDQGLVRAAAWVLLTSVPMFVVFTEQWAKRLPRDSRYANRMMIPFVAAGLVNFLILDDLWLAVTAMAAVIGIGFLVAARLLHRFVFDIWQPVVGVATASGTIIILAVLNNDLEPLLPVAAWFLYGWGTAVGVMTWALSSPAREARRIV